MTTTAQVETSAAVERRLDELDRRAAAVSTELEVVTSEGRLVELEAEQLVLQREARLLRNRLPGLREAEDRARAADERRRQANTARQTQQCLVDADAVFHRLIEMAAELEQIRRSAVQAGANVDIVGTQDQVTSPDRTTPRTAAMTPAFALVDQLAAHLTSSWPTFLASARAELGDSAGIIE